jgi:hypothetical protein
MPTPYRTENTEVRVIMPSELLCYSKATGINSVTLATLIQKLTYFDPKILQKEDYHRNHELVLCEV